jgi:hypothetical protein
MVESEWWQTPSKDIFHVVFSLFHEKLPSRLFRCALHHLQIPAMFAKNPVPTTFPDLLVSIQASCPGHIGGDMLRIQFASCYAPFV